MSQSQTIVQAMMDEYAAIQAVNWSSLKYLATSPLLYQWRKDNPEPPKDGFRIGGAIHTLVLEPTEFPKRYATWGRRTKADKAAPRSGQYWDAWLEAHPGKESLTPPEMEHVQLVAGAVYDHPTARSLLTGGRREEGLVWVDSATGILCKGRLDYITPHGVRDLKTTTDVSERACSRTMAQFLYHGQLAFYHDGAIAAGRIPPDAEEPWTIWAQKVGPYDVAPEQLSPEDLVAGRHTYRTFLHLLKDCMETDYWPGICPDYRTSNLPGYAFGRMDADAEAAANSNPLEAYNVG